MDPTASRIDVRTIAPRERHPLIFSTLGKLAKGQAMELVNDHDAADCRFRGVLAEAVAAFYAVLDRYTVADFAGNRRELATVLFPASAIGLAHASRARGPA